MMRDGKVTLLLSIMTVVVLQEGTGQFPPQMPGKWRNPYIQAHVRSRCRTLGCPGIENSCDFRPYPCFAPPCDSGPTCVVNPGSSSKPGFCTSPFNIWARRIRCSEDIGCYNSDICCHGFFGSECSVAMMN